MILKRSSFGQAGGGIVRETIALLKESGKELFMMEELLGICVWKEKLGRQRQHVLVLEAIEKGGCAKMVTKSDEVFALSKYWCICS